MNGFFKLIAPSVVALSVAACNAGGGSSNLPGATGQQMDPATHSVGSVQEQLKSPSVRVCPDRRGQPTCLALVHTGVTGNVAGWTATNLEAAYNLTSDIGSKGKGQTVAIVDAFDNPNISTDLATYRSEFGLGTATFTKYNQTGQQSNYPSGNHNWGLEEDLDVQMVSASCPNCSIILVEANGADTSDFEIAEAEAVTLGAHIISNSWDCPGSNNCVPQSSFDSAGVTYLASSGDGGYGTGAPAALASVIAVGGTVLSQAGGKRGWSEIVWPGTGSGCATGVPKPAWQHDPGCSSRTENDVSAVAVNAAEYDSYGYGGWITVDGTSISSPFNAGIFGLAGNATKQHAGQTFWKTGHEKAKDLNKVTSGSNGSCSPTYLCTDGTKEYKLYGGPTGWGTPNGIGAY